MLIAPESPTVCKACPAHAVCYGGYQISPVPGYWRSSNSSINFIQCFNRDACRGSTLTNYHAQGRCASGYRGVLCAQCDLGYVRNGSFQCAKCPEGWQNIILLIVACLVVVTVLVILIKCTLKSMTEKKSPFSAYFKILANHLHLVLLTASFELSWPRIISDFFESTEPAANVSDRLISIDCFFDSQGMF